MQVPPDTATYRLAAGTGTGERCNADDTELWPHARIPATDRLRRGWVITYDRRTEEPRTSEGRCEHEMVTQERISIVVVLPAPFGPRKAKIAPVAPGHRCPRPPRGCRSA